MKICVPNNTIQSLVDANIPIDFKGFSCFDMWSAIELNEEIAKHILDNKLEWRRDYFDF